ncbi:DUF6731 family protein [Hymenobacter terrestris]|uniref:Uncharacterized protein n=1 Tax=Hymenobacter terrestris TaxID=2748310 RepID=A0ABX2Q0M2_9BACT|nr:DUF6731 family protein [Hymenobacter terrestris]NVO84484.1 hypothetical protein [Hymenobacter terrestris]
MATKPTNSTVTSKPQRASKRTIATKEGSSPIPPRIAHSDRTIHYYDITFSFKDDSLPYEHFVELFKQVVKMSEDRADDRYVKSIDKRLFIQGIRFVGKDKQIHGQLRAVRLDISPEILNMKTDQARDIEMAEEEGIVETTHFVLDYRKKRHRIGIEYNVAGAKAHELALYLEKVGAKAGLLKVHLSPILSDDSLRDFQRRVGALKALEISVPADSIGRIKKYSPGLASSIQASKDFFNCETVILKPTFDISSQSQTNSAFGVVIDVIKEWTRNPLRRKDFEKFSVKGKDSDNRDTLQIFDLLKDDVKDRINVERRAKSRVLNSIDMFGKMVDSMKKRRLI